jgi:hypothetical protein
VLPDDAIPALVAALPRLPEEEQRRVRLVLVGRRTELDRLPAYDSPFAWNLGRQRAQDALETVP